jgi:hypothetical protein
MPGKVVVSLTTGLEDPEKVTVCRITGTHASRSSQDPRNAGLLPVLLPGTAIRRSSMRPRPTAQA